MVAQKKAVKVVGKKNTGVKKNKKRSYTFHIECKNPVEDGILKTASFVSSHFLYLNQEQFAKAMLRYGLGLIP